MNVEIELDTDPGLDYQVRYAEKWITSSVDRHDGAGVLDAGEVLDGAGDADGHVYLGRDDLPGLADLHFVGAVAGVEGGADPVRECVDDVEVLLRAHAAAAGDDLAGALQIPAVAAALLEFDESRVGGQCHVDRQRLDGCTVRAADGGRPRGGADAGLRVLDQ